MMEKVSNGRAVGRYGKLVIFTLIGAFCLAGYFALSFVDESIKSKEEHRSLKIKYSKLQEEFNKAGSTIENLEKKAKESDSSSAALRKDFEKVKQNEKNCIDREASYKEKEVLLSTCQGELSGEKKVTDELREKTEKLQKELTESTDNITLMKDDVKQSGTQKGAISDMEKLVADLKQQNQDLRAVNQEQEKMLKSKNQNNEYADPKVDKQPAKRDVLEAEQEDVSPTMK